MLRIIHDPHPPNAGFPRYGKLFRESSTLWKIFFHTVENPSKPLPLLVRHPSLRVSSVQVSSFTPLPPAPFQPSIIPILNHMNRLPTAA